MTVDNTKEPMGTVIFYGELKPVIWERETDKFVFNIKRLEWDETKEEWQMRERNYEDKMDKEEIFPF